MSTSRGHSGLGGSVLRRVTGMGTAGSLALALLAGGCVLAATAGPRQAQATGTRALQRTVDGVSTLGQTIVVSTSWVAVNGALGVFDYGTGMNLEPSDLAQVTTQLRGDFGKRPLPLARQAADWVGMAAGPYPMTKPPAVLNGIPANLEVAYRSPLASHVRLVAGTMSDAGGPRRPHLDVVVTTAMASAFALRPGSQISLTIPSQPTPGQTSQSAEVYLDVDVTGIVEPADPDSSFWEGDPLLPRPSLDYTAGGSTVWVGSVIADPGEIDMVQSTFGQTGLGITWNLPVDTTGLHAQAQAVFDQVSQFTNRAPALTGQLAQMANAMTVSSALQPALAALVQDTNAVNVLLWMVYVGLALAGVVMLLLAVRMVAARRSAEMAVQRARGASLEQLFFLGSLGAAVACVPAAALAWAVAVLLVPDSTPAGPAAWWPGIATLAIATAGPGIAVAWQHRGSVRGRARRRRRWATRAVFEATACAAAIGGLTVARAQPGGGGDLYTSAAPVLVAVPAVIVVLRLYSLLLRGLARASARRRGVIGFLGLSRASQATLTLALPAMTLVLAVTVAAFTGMVRDAVARGETAVSWQTTGADDVVTAPFSPNTLESLISPSAVRAIATVPGVQHAATALVVPFRIGDGEEITCIVVDPASYATLVTSTEGFSPVNPALLAGPSGQGVIPVLASPQAAAYLRAQATGQISTITAQQGLPPLRVRVSGELQSTPALPAGGSFIVAPLSAIHGIGEPVNLMLLTGSSIDMTKLRAAVRTTTQGGGAPSIISRSLALQELAGAPLQQGTFVLFTLAIGFAAALALAVMLLELALGARDREQTTARLATMGLTDGRRFQLAAFEVLPAIAASAVAAIASAVALPGLIASQVNLSVFTQSSTPVSLRPDVASFALPLAGLLAVTVIALAYEIRSVRRHGVAVTMRGS
jgi:putative ABC transport system permease protein